MTTASYPVTWSGTVTAGVPSPTPRAEQALDGPKWLKMFDHGDGVTGDLTGDSFALTAGAGDNVTLALGRYRLDGLIFEVTAAHTVAMPAPGSGSYTYVVAAVYDPALSEAVGGPITLVTSSSGSVTVPSGGKVAELWRVTRAFGQTLASALAAAVRRYQWASEVSMVATAAALPAVAPTGAMCMIAPAGDMYYRKKVGASLAWVSLAAPQSAAVTPAAGWLVYPGIAPAVERSGDGIVRLSGLVTRTVASTLPYDSLLTVATLASQYWPPINRYQPIMTRTAVAELIVTTTGVVMLRARLGGLSLTAGGYLSLDGVTYRGV